MAHIIRSTNFLNEVDYIIDRQIKVDRIICDFPSFVKRHPGVPSKEYLTMMLQKLTKLIKSDLFSQDGSLTISFTGDIQREFKEWMEQEGNQYLEHLPEHDHTCFYTYLVDKRDGSLFVGRRANWAWVATFRKTGSEWQPNDIETYKHVPGKFEKFFVPPREQITVHSFRAPVHKGLNEAAEHESWIENVCNIDPADVVARQKFIGKPKGLLVNYNLDRGKYYHMAGQVEVAGYATQEFQDKVYDPDNRTGLGHLAAAGSFHYCMMLVQRYSNEGDYVFAPFIEDGDLQAAVMVSKRTLHSCELNQDRAMIAQEMQRQLLTSI